MKTPLPHDPDRHTSSLQLQEFMQAARDLRLAAKDDAQFSARRDRLRAWQAERLALTHADLLVSDRYRPAAMFFLSDLYGPKDFSARDAALERMFPIMVNVLPVSGLQTVSLAIELDALSERMDGAMTRALDARLDKPLSNADYAWAYAKATTREDRERQLILIRETGRALEALAKRALIRAALKMMQKPAEVAGLGDLHDFLQRGFEAFRAMGDASEFLAKIEGREGEILLGLFAANPDVLPVRSA